MFSEFKQETKNSEDSVFTYTLVAKYRSMKTYSDYSIIDEVIVT